ncbi:MAG: asparagine synthase (glutamine-hydrolyzing) [bacterium]
MCGIVGFWGFNGSDISDKTLDNFVAVLKHRGPDGVGIYRDKEACLSLGHSRLAILDLSPSGHQPMPYAHGRYWIAYNGEVYNFIEIRQELESLGHTFISDSDTEVVVAAYAQWGEDCQLRFNGMWAFAIWDSKERVLFLSRDRFGIKPLHYVYTPSYFAFASEMKAFLTLDCFDYAFDHDIMTETLADIKGLEGTEFCLLKGVTRLIGGHCLALRDGKLPQIHKWWNTLDHLEKVPRRFEEQVERFRELYFDACKIRMRSDVPLATSLSGGLDSSAVLCTIHEIGKTQNFSARTTHDWQKAFVACFPGTHLDELQYARRVVEEKGALPFYNDIAIEAFISKLGDMVYQFEELYFVLLAGLWLNYREMRNNSITVSLDGHGADELLGGYHFIVEEEMANALFPRLQITRYMDLRKTLKGFIGGSNEIDMSFFKDIRLLVRQYKRYCATASWAKYAKPLWNNIRKATLNMRQNFHSNPYAIPSGFLPMLPEKKTSMLLSESNLRQNNELRGLTHLNRNLYIFFNHTVLPTILRNFDRASMAHGVEVRMPFMDWRLVCFSFSLPDESKIGSGYAKRILRESMRSIIPESIRMRTNKIGFTSPMAQWFEGPLQNFLLDSVNDDDFLSSAIWNGPVIRSFVEECVHKKAWTSLERAWRYVNAHILMKEFNNHRLAYRVNDQ